MKNLVCENCGVEKFWVYVLNTGHIMIECDCGWKRQIGMCYAVMGIKS